MHSTNIYILPAEKKIYNPAADTLGMNELTESEISSDATVVDSEELLEDNDDLDDPDIGDFLYEALYNDHPVEVNVDLDVLAGV